MNLNMSRNVMIKKHLKLAVYVLAFSFTHSLSAKAPTYWWTSTALSIRTSAPPALMYVSDSQGRITGTNTNSPVNQFGQQKISARLQNIPHSGAVETNIADNDTDQPNPNTECDVNIMDGGVQSYAIHLLGISNDFEQVIIDLNYSSTTVTALTETIFVPTETGVSKTVVLNCDPENRTLGLELQVSPGDFLKDTQAACGLGSISPPEACEALEALATVVEKAKSKGDSRLEAETIELYLSILNRLHNWGQKGYRQDWDDFKDRHECDHLRQKDLHETKFFAKDPAYSALKLDAETLLKGLPKERDHDHDQDGHRVGDERK
jgi:hypothetical protein